MDYDNLYSIKTSMNRIEALFGVAIKNKNYEAAEDIINISNNFYINFHSKKGSIYSVIIKGKLKKFINYLVLKYNAHNK